MSAAAKYHVQVIVNVKRTKDEVELAKGELERLHGYIQGGDSPNNTWAKEQIQHVTQMMLLPNADQIKKQITSKLDDPDTK